MRRGVRNVLGAGAAVLCLGGLLSACGGDSGDGYVATGAAGASPGRAPGKTVGPTGDVKLVPLERGGSGDAARHDAPGDARGSSSAGDPGSDDGDSAGKSPRGTGTSDAAKAPSSPESTSRGGRGDGDAHTGSGTGGGSTGPSAPTPGRPRPDPSPSGPAALAFGTPERAPADKRWCEKVTVTFSNSGGSPVRSGKVTFGTHIIGALGVDWATIKSTVDLPAPIAPGQKKAKTWPVCVDAWRVPLGMRVETRDVWVDWE